MVKNPMHADLKLWIGALERVASCTRGQVCGLHRGFSSYGSSEFRNAPMWEIPIALRSEMPEVPLFCDPSHISGKAEHLQDVAQRAMNLGMEGLMIESHPAPAQALSDAEQQITPAALDQLLAQLDVPVQHVVNDDAQESLDALRLQIDSVDEQLLQMLDKRMTLAREIGALKHRNKWSLLSVARWRDIVKSRLDWASQMGLNHDFLSKILASVHEESIRVQGDEADKERSKQA